MTEMGAQWLEKNTDSVELAWKNIMITANWTQPKRKLHN